MLRNTVLIIFKFCKQLSIKGYGYTAYHDSLLTFSSQKGELVTIFLNNLRNRNSFSIGDYDRKPDEAWLDIAAIGAAAYGLSTMVQIADAVNELLSAYLGPLLEEETSLSRKLVLDLATFLNRILRKDVDGNELEGVSIPELKTFLDRQPVATGNRRRTLRWDAGRLPSRIGADVNLLGAEPSSENALIARDAEALSS